MSFTTYSFREFVDLVPAFEDSRLPVLLRGSTGIGKSDVVEQRAQLRGLPVVALFASQIGEGDLSGLPDPAGVMVNGVKATTFNPAEEIIRACTQPVVLFFDELDRGILEVRQAIFQLACNRMFKGWKLHPDTLVFAAVNGGLHRSAGTFQVNEMDPAELSRWSCFDIAITVTDWLTWAAANLSNMLIHDFIRDNNDHLMHKDMYEPNVKYPDPRSWARLDKVFKNAGIYNTEDYKNQAVGGKIFQLANAVVGQNAALALQKYASTIDKQVSAADILDHGKIELTKSFGVVEHTALVDRIIKSGVFAAPISDLHAANIARYFVKLPSEVAIFFMTNWNPKLAEGSTPIKNNLKILAAGNKLGLGMNAHIVSLTTATTKQK